MLFFIFVVLILVVRFVNSQESKVDKEVYEELGGKEEVRVVIELRVEEEKGFLFKRQKTDLEIEEEKKEIKEKIEEEVGEENVKHVFDEHVAVSVSEKELRKLNNDKNIESIVIDKPVTAFLQDSVPLINTTNVWPIQLSNFNITGIDETVCILDTGINFSHPDLVGKNKTCIIDCNGPACAEDCSVGDDNGHGTHVAGIVAASAGINGVSKGASLIGVKVLNSTGSGSGSDVNAGIEWCIDNAATYNISVISMSLGTNCVAYPQFCYDEYCDPDETTAAPLVNEAISKNISVIAATGNNGNYTAISSPACIRNITAVGWSNKNDAINVNSNRNNLTDLFAPGNNINSTYAGAGCLTNCQCSGNYMVCSGTSMAAPHVSAAFALIKQFYRLQSSRILMPIEILSSLNSSGIRIYDSSSGLNFSRIDVLSAIMSLDEDNPEAVLVQPEDNLFSTSQNQTFSCNATDSVQLKNITLQIWNSTSLYYENTSSINGFFSGIEWNVSGIDYGNYKWNCLAYDGNNNSAYATNNFTLIVSEISVNLISPDNGLITNNNKSFSCNVSSTQELVNITFYLWNSTSIVNTSTEDISGLVNSTIFYYNFTKEDNYKWNCLAANNLSSESFATSNFSVTYDLTPPLLEIVSPVNNTFYDGLRFNVSLNENSSSCWFSLNHGENTSMSMINRTYFNYTNLTVDETSSSDEHNVSFYCNDSAGNENSSSLVFFGIDKSKPVVTLVEPFPGDETASSVEKTFYFNVTDNLNVTCSLVIDGLINLTNSSVNQSQTQELSLTFGTGAYSWSVNCTDSAGNQGNSSQESFTITSPPTQVASSGGGGGGGEPTSRTYAPTTEQVSGGYTKDLSEGDKIKFTFFDVKASPHTLTVERVGEDFVDLTIQSNTIKLTLGIGQSAKLNLTSADYYDLYIKLESITNNQAKLTIQTINEKISKITIGGQTIREEEKDERRGSEETDEKQEELGEERGSLMYIVLIYIGVVVFIGILFSLIVTKLKKKSQKKIKKKLRKKRKNRF